MCLSVFSFLGCGESGGNKEGWTSVYNGGNNELIPNGEWEINLDKEIGDANYFKLTLSSEVILEGEINYSYGKNGFNSDTSETFWTLAGENLEFRQIIDFYGDRTGDKRINYILFKNIDNKNGEVTIAKAEVAKHPIDFSDVIFTENKIEEQMQLFLEGETIKFGCSIKSGGAVNWLSAKDGSVKQINQKDGSVYIGKSAKEGTVISSDVNLINTHDNGRLVQQSYYGIPWNNDQGYKPGSFGVNGGGEPQPWGYNPVQGGDKGNYFSQLVDVKVTDTEIYTKARPMDWGKLNEVTKSYMENWYTLGKDAEHGEYVTVRNRFTDFSGYNHNNSRHQELPAFYGVSPLGKAVYYGGESPWDNGAVTENGTLGFWQGNPQSNRFHCTENWISWVNEDNWGVGLYVPDVSTVLVGRTLGFNVSSEELADKPYMAASSTYAAPLAQFTMQTYQAFDYTYYLSLNDVTNLRALFNKMHADGASNEYLKGKEAVNW